MVLDRLGGEALKDKDTYKDTNLEAGEGLFEGRRISRREFLKLAGVTGAAIGVGASLGGALAACGGATTTTSAAATTTTAGAATAASAAAATTSTAAAATATTAASAAAQTGRELKIGFVTPLTGSLASFAVSDSYCMTAGRRPPGTAWY